MERPDGILLLGASGFVGRCLVKSLHGQGRKVYAVSRTVPPADSANIHFIQSSIDNPELLEKILPECAVVLHLASDTTPGSSALKPSVEARLNLLPTLRFLECLQRHPHVRLIFLSSGGTVYGTQGVSHLKEDVALLPNSYYGAGKVAIEKFIFAYSHQTKGQVTILRPSNFYGPGQPYRAGFGIIPTIFNNILNDEILQIWGDGETVRDYLFIHDFIGLCLKLLSLPPSDGTSGAEVFNVGSGQGTSLNELCELVEKVTGRRVRRRYVEGRSVDVRRIVLDCTALVERYGWQVKTELTCGLEQTWQWFQKYADECGT
jgi:UDP-glucose 4-epimerase